MHGFGFGWGEFYSVACALAWAIAVVLFKKSGESLAPFALNLFKNVLAAALLAATLWLLPGEGLPQMPASAWALTLISGFLGIGLGDTFFFRALNAIGAGRMAVAQTMYSPCVILLSMLFLGEWLHLWQWLGVALVVGGVLLVSYTRERSVAQRELRRGALWGVAAVGLMASGIVIAKPLLEQYDFVWVVQLRVLGGIAGMGLYLLLRGNARGLLAEYRQVRHWPQVIAGSVMGSYVAMMLWLAGYKYTTASVAAVLNETAAVFIVILAVLFLRETVSRRQWAGSVLAISGVMLVVLR